jgi:hypothetical protein
MAIVTNTTSRSQFPNGVSIIVVYILAVLLSTRRGLSSLSNGVPEDMDRLDEIFDPQIEYESVRLNQHLGFFRRMLPRVVERCRAKVIYLHYTGKRSIVYQHTLIDVVADLTYTPPTCLTEGMVTIIDSWNMELRLPPKSDA